MDLIEAANIVERFAGASLTDRIAELERAMVGKAATSLPQLSLADTPGDLLSAAANLKRVAAQVDTMIHAIGISLCLPHILESGEVVESASLGAGNTGKAFDVETNRRVAEFKFIRWQGGAESVRQSGLFKDFYKLAEHETTKRKYVYLLGTEHGLKFLRGGRKMTSVLRGHAELQKAFFEKYGERYSVVRDYYESRASAVSLVDVTEFVPGLTAP